MTRELKKPKVVNVQSDSQSNYHNVNGVKAAVIYTNEEIEADQFKEHTDNLANAYVADVQAVDVEVLMVKSGGPIGGGGHNASSRIT